MNGGQEAARRPQQQQDTLSPAGSPSATTAKDNHHATTPAMRIVSLTSLGNEEGFIFLKNHPQPTIAPNQVLVRVKACAVTPLDREARKGHHQAFVRPPAILGYAIAGVVSSLGLEVEHLRSGEEVVGVIPMDSGGGNAEYVAIDSAYLAKKPAEISFEEAAGALIGGIRAYTALHYHAHLVPGDSVLILDGASTYGHLAVQLAGLWGAKIITTASSPEEFTFLQNLSTKIDRIIDTSTENLFNAVMDETGGLGVDILVESHRVESPPAIDPPSSASSNSLSSPKGKQDQNEDENDEAKARYKNDELVRCLAVHGRWVASSYLQLDPPTTRLLYLRGASLSFLFEQTWLLSPLQQGRYLHILEELLEKIRKEEIRVRVANAFPLEKIREAHRLLDSPTLVGTIVIKP
ncbi:Alcohol dehydrogenase GroES-like domain [Balamuthia mandrillaris]